MTVSQACRRRSSGLWWVRRVLQRRHNEIPARDIRNLSGENNAASLRDLLKADGRWGVSLCSLGACLISTQRGRGGTIQYDHAPKPESG